MISVALKYFLCSLLLLISFSVTCQDFFKRLEESDKFFNQRITHFPNGDLLIGDSSLEAQRTGSGGQIFMTRIDPCGNVEWSKTYERQEEYLEFKDFEISDNNDIFIFGSAYSDLDELLFFLKLNGSGEVIKFQLYETGTVDHFSYSIDLKNNQILAYGLILDFGTQKQGFISIFDENLVFQWGKKFSPFESQGDAYFAKDNGFICRSGPYLFKLDQNGEIEWATIKKTNVVSSPIAGPIEVPDGYIMQSYGEGFSFFYKVGLDGRLIWQSDKFQSNPFPADLTILDNGNMLVTYIYPETNQNRLSYLMLSPNGSLSGQHKLNIDLSMQTGTNYHSLSDDGVLSISGNADPFSTVSVDVSSFLMQSDLEENAGDCFSWEPFSALEPNDVDLSFVPLDTTTVSSRMDRRNTGKMAEYLSDSPLVDGCDLEGLNFITIDTLLPCGVDWLVSLPDEDFTWEDDSPDNPRTLDVAGTYLAKNKDCGNLITYAYVLQKPACSCPVYLPTAFSPNQDGRNDLLQFFSECELMAMKMTVFSRWGEKIFESRNSTDFWDGLYRGKLAPNDVYLVVVNYHWQDQDGVLQQGSVQQSVTVIK